ncbi:hypothetical protein N665_0239s0001 [Sinapis alba]|nr:hypothetical protein N665_0239s0001 [Sinapis alba]
MFCDTIDKMGIDLCDLKPSSQSLTPLNGSSELMLGTICLPVYTCRVTRTFKYSIIRMNAPYNAILGTPWIYSMKVILSTYHQCVKFPGRDGQIRTFSRPRCLHA